MGVLQVGKEDENQAILYAEVFGKLIKPQAGTAPIDGVTKWGRQGAGDSSTRPFPGTLEGTSCVASFAEYQGVRTWELCLISKSAAC